MKILLKSFNSSTKEKNFKKTFRSGRLCIFDAMDICGRGQDLIELKENKYMLTWKL